MPRKSSKTGTQSPPSSQQDHDTEVLRARVALLFEGSTLTLAISLAVAIVFVLVHASVNSLEQGEIYWAMALAGTLLPRMWLLIDYRRQPGPVANPQRWLAKFRIGALLSAAVWGAGGILFYLSHEATLQVFTLLVIAGIAAGALSSLSPDFHTYRDYVLLCLVPVGIGALFEQQQLQMGIGLLILLLVMFLIRSGKRTSESIISSLQLRFENADLLKDLEREKRRLLNEAESMMGSVLASAPIALWVVEDGGAIQFIDGQRLQRQTGITLPDVGDNLYRAFERYPQVKRDAQRALAGETFTDELTLDNHHFEVHYGPLANEFDQPGRAIGVAIDISERKRQEQELTQRANFDELTGLANRTYAKEEITRALARARRSGSQVGLFFFDLDNFKSINDSLGHNAGDLLLKKNAQRLLNNLRESDFAARISGDEFLVVAERLDCQEDAEALAHKLTAAFRDPFLLQNRPIYATASIGIAMFPSDGHNADQLMQCADTAMYHAKAHGRNNFSFFTGEMQQEAERHLSIETELRQALTRNELELVYQPKVDSKTLQIVGAEALLRWHSSALGQVSPDQFIPVAELAGLMPGIGDWVLHTACREASCWQKLSERPLQVAINISPQQFRTPDLLANVTHSLVASGLSPGLVELEITEGLLVQDTPDIMRNFEALDEMGISLAIDDFGTGYSSLSYLRKFPLDVLKIDRSFVIALDDHQDGGPLLHAIIAMAKSLRMKIVAEGVETASQLEYLQASGVEMIQGYYFSKPVDAETFRELLQESEDGPLMPASYAKQLGRPASKSG